MELIREHWDKSMIEEFQNYLKGFENNDRKEWATKLLNTELPVLCLKTPVIKNIINEISKGNYIEFLDLMIWDYYENTAINGYLICKIKDFNIMRKYLDIYSKKADNWATCDLLSFDTITYKKEYIKLAEEYIKSEMIFVRRIGYYILFNYINEEYIEKIFDFLEYERNEEEYYVYVMKAWLLCDCFIKSRDRTLKYLDNNHLNKETINKFVQKCRDSNRVNRIDKDMLRKYKK